MGVDPLKPQSAPYWPGVVAEALQPDNLPRVLASMRFDRFIGTITRGTIRWWPPEYARPPAPEALHAYPKEIASSFIASRRAEMAALNRALRDSPVHLVSLGDRIICIDEFGGDGEWRSADGANRGPDLITLGVWRWKVPSHVAGERIAHVIGMQIPILRGVS